MTEDKDKLDHTINFRSTEKMFKELMNYLKQTGETISVFMRQATYDYLLFKKAMEENGYGKVGRSEIKIGNTEIKINAPPPEIMYCDSERCGEVIPQKIKEAVDKHDQ